MDKRYYVYVMTNQWDSVFYTGITNNLVRRIYEHKNKLVKGFTEKYKISRLIYFEEFSDPREAITREKQFKDYNRAKKLEIIERVNPFLKDLYNEII